MAGFKLSDASSVHAESGHRDKHDHPLGLTVHSLPNVEGALERTHRTLIGRWKMLLVLLVCAAPVIASYVTYYFVRPEARRVFGELVSPQRPLPDLRGLDPAGASINLRSLKGQWLLVTVSGGACAELCQRNLYLQRQMRESLGRDKDRVERVWLVNDQDALDQPLLAAFRDATVLRVDAPALAQWLRPAAGQALADHLYLVDPMGNWMMRFPPRLDAGTAAKAKRDLERLLRASASWDTPGR